MASVDRSASDSGSANTVLSLSEVTCPICMSILIEPVTMPCSHSLCMPCFKQHVAQTSLACPLCRKRISIWVRHNTKAKRLVNTRLWRKIQDSFASKVEARIHGHDESDDEDTFVLRHMSAPGEIREEYEALLADELQEAALKRNEEEVLSIRLIQQLQDEEKMQLRERQKEQEHLEKNDAVVAQQIKEAEKMLLQEQLKKVQQLCASDEAVARQIEEEEQKLQRLKKRVNGSPVTPKLVQTPKKPLATSAYGPMDVFIDRKMAVSPRMSQHVTGTPASSVSVSGSSTNTCSKPDNSSKILATHLLSGCTSDSTDSRSGRQLREITSSQSSESDPEESASWVSKHHCLKTSGKENLHEQRMNSPCQVGKGKGKSIDHRTRTNILQLSPDVDNYNGMFALNCDGDAENNKANDENDIEEAFIISKKLKTMTDEEDAVAEITYDSNSMNKDSKIRKKNTSDSSNSDDQHTSVFNEECSVPVSNEKDQHNIQTEMNVIVGDEESSAESLAALIEEQRRIEAQLRQEEEDHHLAEILQMELNKQMREVNRSRGSEDEYSLRNRRTSVSTLGKVKPSKAKKSSRQGKVRQPTLKESIAKRHRPS